MSTVYRKKDDLLARRIAGETIIVPIRGKLADMQNIFALNPVGELIWELLDGSRNVGQIGAAVVDEFDVDADSASNDVAAFVACLLEAVLIEGAD